MKLKKLSIMERLYSIFSPGIEGTCDCYSARNKFNIELLSIKNALDYVKKELDIAKKDIFKNDVIIKSNSDLINKITISKNELSNENKLLHAKYETVVTDYDNKIKKLHDEINHISSKKNILKKELEDVKSKLKKDSKLLSCSDIKQARKRYADGEQIKNLAIEFNVSPSTLSRAISGITYKQCK